MTDTSTLLSASRKYQSDLTAFLRDLVRIQTVNGRHPEFPLAIRIQEEARRIQLESHLVELEPERPNVLVTYGTGTERFALIGHMNTVAEGDESTWSNPPFAAEITD